MPHLALIAEASHLALFKPTEREAFRACGSLYYAGSNEDSVTCRAGERLFRQRVEREAERRYNMGCTHGARLENPA